jgi:hypothetical protein
MGLPQDDRVMLLRRLARKLEASPPTPERDDLLGRARLRIVELEAWEELGPPSSLPALSEDEELTPATSRPATPVQFRPNRGQP